MTSISSIRKLSEEDLPEHSAVLVATGREKHATLIRMSGTFNSRFRKGGD